MLDRILRHPVVVYFTLTFAITWGGLLSVFGPGGLTTTDWQSDPRITLMGVLLLAGPSISGLLMIGLVSGREGYRDLFSRLVNWRVEVRWYAFAILLPALAAAAVSLLSTPAIAAAQDKAQLVFSGAAVGLLVGTFEELGWTGFAIPRLRRHYSVLTTGLLVGVVWGAWHFPMNWQPQSFAAPLAFTLLLARLFSWLPAFRLLMVWLHDRTQSLLLPILMHASLVASSTVIFLPIKAADSDFLLSVLLTAAIFWSAVVVVFLSPVARTAPRRAAA